MKPLLNTTQAEEKQSEGRSVLATGLEKLKSTIHPGRSSQLSEQEADRKKVRCQDDVKKTNCSTAPSGEYQNNSVISVLINQ